MFTSRAEFRTLLRQDNADLRLTEIGFKIGLASQERMDKVIEKRNDVERIKLVLKTTFLDPDEINPYFAEMGGAEISEKQRLERIILRPNTSLKDIRLKVDRVHRLLEPFNLESLEQAEIQVKYEVYISKEKELVERMSLMEGLAIPEQFDYFKINALGVEAKEKLTKIKPQTLGQASRISGINPSDVQILMVYMGR